ncbi:hypothetical protein GBAR_LOCUS2078 [Geodia barretti]|jgi:hypothetical protein|uniref:Uncharacterized protein n=1 Tax=Geodia barretti TaxID=519541 RepID=A0AA35QYJ2_GEOBA|nr:hypothetical protein GBAR_LOCUS2078 [Geodia barretti]
MGEISTEHVLWLSGLEAQKTLQALEETGSETTTEIVTEMMTGTGSGSETATIEEMIGRVSSHITVAGGRFQGPRTATAGESTPVPDLALLWATDALTAEI